MPLSPSLVLLAQWSSVRCLLCSEHYACNLVEKVEVEHQGEGRQGEVKATYCGVQQLLLILKEKMGRERGFLEVVFELGFI